jgi:3-hydroxyisobutyrate dehydrogenase-like beta-hydroxyacid dehydrogenase
MIGDVGLVGMGLLGSALADRLLQGGRRVLVWDTSDARRVEHASRGGEVASSSRDVFSRCKAVFLSLPDSGVVRDVLTQIPVGTGQVGLIVDTTTGAPADAKDAEARARQVGWTYIECNVLGSSQVVREGRGLALLGAPVTRLDEARLVLQGVFEKVVHLGVVGRASSMKLVANLVLGLHRAVLAEGLALAEALGLDGSTTLEVLKSGVTYSRVMDIKGARMLAPDGVVEARLRQHLKDVGLILAESDAHGARTPLSAVHARLLEELVAGGWGDEDNASIIKAFRRSR